MKFKITLILLLTSLLITEIQAQLPEIVWAKSEGGTASDYVNDICHDANDNIYLACMLNSVSPAILIKYDASGNFLWSKNTVSGTANPTSVKTDALGNVFICGTFSTMSITLDTITLDNAFPTLPDAFIAKYDAAGNLLWAKEFGGNGIEGCGIAADALGNFYLALNSSSDSIIIDGDTYYNSGDISTYDGFLIQGDVDGNINWVKKITGAKDDRYSSILTDAAGNIFVSGSFASPVCNVDSGSVFLSNSDTTGFPTFDFYIAKYNTSGDLVWVNQSTGGSHENIFNIAMNENGELAITGDLWSNTMTFDSITITKGTSISNIITSKLDTAGNVFWIKNVDANATANTCGLDSSGNVFIAGGFYGNVVIDTVALTNAGTGGDIFISKIDPTGNFIWSQSYGSNNDDYCPKILVEPNGDFVSTGYFKGTSITLGITTLFNSGTSSYDIFLARSTSTNTGIANIGTKNKNDVVVSPNPFIDHVNVDLISRCNEKADVKVVDISGKVICNEKVQLIVGSNSIKLLSSGNWPAGVYFLYIDSAKFNYFLKMIKQN